MADSGFLTKDDFITIITVAALDNLTDYNDDIIDTMVVEAVLEIFSYLDGRYNVTEIISGDSLLLPTLQMYCKDIVLYHLHSRHHLRPMPDIRRKRYERALEWCREAQEQKLNPFVLIDTTEAAKPLVKTGGNAKRENHQV